MWKHHPEIFYFPWAAQLLPTFHYIVAHLDWAPAPIDAMHPGQELADSRSVFMWPVNIRDHRAVARCETDG